jgi:hypothetical protein
METVAICEPRHEEFVVELVNDIEIWKIVAHIAFKFYSGAPGTFSTAATSGSAARIPRRSEAEG